MKCPYFERRTSSHRFFGIKCKHFGGSMGSLQLWSKGEREAHIEKYCDGDYESCHQYQNIKNNWSK